VSTGLGFCAGGFEYAVDVVPVYLIFQRMNTAYGWGFNPLGLKWNFVRREEVLAVSGVERGSAVQQAEYSYLYEYGELHAQRGVGDAYSWGEI